MKYYTVEETAKKLRVSTGHVYELVKRGELKKKEGTGRLIRIPSSELKVVRAERNYFIYDEDKVEVIETHLGKVRKIKNEDSYVVRDLVEILNLKDSYSIVRRLEGECTKIDCNKSAELGLFSNQRGLLLITYKGIESYSRKSRSKDTVDFKRLLNELNVTNCKEVSKVDISTSGSIHVFKNFEFGEIRTININNEPWFIGKDVAEVLGYKDTSDALKRHIDEEDKGVGEIPTRGGIQKLKLINESGLYSLILSSKLSTAKKFKRWVASEVLPTIRKTGGYVDNSNKFVDNYFNNLSIGTKEIIKRELENKNKELINRKKELIIEAGELKREYDINKKVIEQLNI